MKRLIPIYCILFGLGQQFVIACDLCKKNQPKGFENITHGQGPTGNMDYIITWSAIILVIITLFFSIKFLVRPRENNPEHIKHIVWDQNLREHGGQ
ncbi:hypothetical protein [Allomuricauda sp. F6463D]|uniref:hypothetical protein n=1 Tax=Allomuricauda sp. F6463D TaxID=2926409 RepID=UPI001FF21399|nr:hypothetical protein [Muricauda sp. F6463D]MCK0159094.1 hypothetical protein [Muricauda sp. F6463D]